MKFDVMECFRMYYILVSLLFIAMGQSEAGDIEYQGKLPQTVFVGDNVTFQWLYTGTENVAITWFRIFENSYETLIYYAVKLKDTSKPQIKHNNIKKIATTAKWDGDYEKNQYNFTLVNVTDFAHQKNFSIQLELDNGPGTLLLGFTKDLLLVSVIPEVQLQIDKTNVSVGDRVRIRCNIVTEGRPEVTISLYRNNTLLESTKRLYLSYSKEVELKDAGSYRCKAKNNAGEDNSEIMKITVHEKKEEDKKEEGNPVGNPSAGKSDGLGGGAIAGIVVGILVLVVIIVVLVIIFLKRRTSVPKSNKRATVNDDESKSAMVSKPEKDQVWL